MEILFNYIDFMKSNKESKLFNPIKIILDESIKSKLKNLLVKCMLSINTENPHTVEFRFEYEEVKFLCDLLKIKNESIDIGLIIKPKTNLFYFIIKIDEYKLYESEFINLRLVLERCQITVRKIEEVKLEINTIDVKDAINYIKKTYNIDKLKKDDLFDTMTIEYDE